MQTCTSQQMLPFEAGDTELVADRQVASRGYDLDAVADQLDELARVLREAAQAHRRSARLNTVLPGEALTPSGSRVASR